MKKYPKSTKKLSKDFKFWKYKIIVPNEETKKEIMNAFKYIHNMIDLDTDYVIINQLVHEYEDGRNIFIKEFK